MGADRQRHHAQEGGGHGDRAAGEAKLGYIHPFHPWSLSKARASSSRLKPSRFVGGYPILCRPIALNLRHSLINLWHCSKQTVNSQAPVRQRLTALFDHGGIPGSMHFSATF